MLALPPAPAPTPKRQILVTTGLFAAAGLMLLGAMTALWFRFRNVAGTTNWKPAKAVIPEVATNTMLLTMVLACAIVQWAVYAAKRGDHHHVNVAVGIVFVLGLALINSQAYVWKKIALPVKGETAYNSMFYAFTGVLFALYLIGVVYAAVAALRSVGGRTRDRETISGLALYWYFLAAATAAVWFVVYVTK